MVMLLALAALVMNATMPLAPPVVLLPAPVVTLIGPVPWVPANMPFCPALMLPLLVWLMADALAALVISACMPSVGGSIAPLFVIVTLPVPAVVALTAMPPAVIF